MELLANQDVGVLISGRYGPTAFSAIERAGMEAYLGDTGTPLELVKEYQAGSLRRATRPSGKGFHGGRF